MRELMRDMGRWIAQQALHMLIGIFVFLMAALLIYYVWQTGRAFVDVILYFVSVAS